MEMTHWVNKKFKLGDDFPEKNQKQMRETEHIKKNGLVNLEPSVTDRSV